jgi:hypothetical protein
MPSSTKKPSATRAKENIDIAHDVVEKFIQSLTWREPYKTKWDRFYKMYRGVLEETNYPWQSNVWVPVSFSTVETVVPRLVSNRPQIDKMGMNVILPEAVKEMCIYGTTILKVFWLKKEGNIFQKEMVDENMPEIGTVTTDKEGIIYNGPKCEVVDLYDFFIDPRATTIDEAEWVIHRTVRSYEYIMGMAKEGKYKNTQLLKDSSSFASNDDQKSERRSAIGLSLPDTMKNQNLVELLECWWDDRIVTIANRSIVIREDKNPYKHGKKPFVACVDQKVPHEFYGTGELEPIETLQYELNDRRNQRMDNVTLVLNRMWKVVNGMGVDEDELVSGAGGVVHMDNSGAVDVFPMQDVTSSSYQEDSGKV